MSRPGTLLIDFDGTISTVDIGSRLFDRLSRGRARSVVDSWLRGEIGSRECLIQECAASRGTAAEVREFARQQPVDPGFDSFLARAEHQGWAVRVVSDGLDGYIRTVMEREGWGRIPVYANRVRFVGDRLLPSFPFAGQGCGACGHCKRAEVERARGAGEVVFIGNGFSDRCGAEVADRVYARDDLARYCREAGVAHTPFSDFFEIAKDMFGAASIPCV